VHSEAEALPIKNSTPRIQPGMHATRSGPTRISTFRVKPGHHHRHFPNPWAQKLMM
jgi:hypothetical protein